MRRKLSLAAGALLVAIGLGMSCGPETESASPTGGSAGAAGGGPDGGAGTLGGSGAVAGAGSGGTGGTGTGGLAGLGGMWQQPGDPGWKPVPWQPAGCDAEYATNVANAAPPLIWADCGLPGCTRLVPIWSPKVGDVYAWPIQAPPQVYRSGSLLRFSLHFMYGKTVNDLDQRKIIYDENWKALAVWRGKECGGNVLQWTGKHVCTALGGINGQMAQVTLSLSDLTGPPLAKYDEGKVTIPLGCTEDLFASSSGGGTQHVRDLVSGIEYMLAPPTGGIELGDQRLIGEYALIPRIASGSNGPLIDGWIWKRPNVLEKLVDPGNEVIYDIRSDGKTLVWVQTQSKDILESAPGELWTSGFATTAAGIQAQKRRPVPASSLAASMKGVGDGWYALVEQPVGSDDRFLHVYRLSDARHWVVPTPADVRPTDIVHIDSQEVWFTGMTATDSYSTVVRQKLSALGPGD